MLYGQLLFGVKMETTNLILFWLGIVLIMIAMVLGVLTQTVPAIITVIIGLLVFMIVKWRSLNGKRN